MAESHLIGNTYLLKYDVRQSNGTYVKGEMTIAAPSASQALEEATSYFYRVNGEGANVPTVPIPLSSTSFFPSSIVRVEKRAGAVGGWWWGENMDVGG